MVIFDIQGPFSEAETVAWWPVVFPVTDMAYAPVPDALRTIKVCDESVVRGALGVAVVLPLSILRSAEAE